MFSLLSDLFKDEMKAHPHLFVLLALFAAGILGYSYNTFAQQVWVAEEMETTHNSFGNVNKRIDALEQKIDVRHFEQRLASTASEVFALERIAQSGDATVRDIQRLDDLRISYEKLQRQLSKTGINN